jgi:hypothetical protein
MVFDEMTTKINFTAGKINVIKAQEKRLKMEKAKNKGVLKALLEEKGYLEHEYNTRSQSKNKKRLKSVDDFEDTKERKLQEKMNRLREEVITVLLFFITKQLF